MDENAGLLTNIRRLKQQRPSWVFAGLIVLILLVQIFTVVYHLYPGALDSDPVRLRREWDLERKAHQAQMENERRGWDEEKRQWKEKAAEQEQKESEWNEKERELERRRDVLRWGEVRLVDRCSRFAVREYTATLVNRPMNYDGRLSCAANPIDINGVTYDTPDYCEDVVRSSLLCLQWVIMLV